MDTKFIQTLVSVVDTGSFAAAARYENLTPAAVSQRVRSLEAELGETLIVRAGRQVVPTPACISILPRMRHIVREVRQITSDFDTGGLNGQINVGAISTALSDHIPDALLRFAQHAPDANLSITPGTSDELFSKLLNEELDAAFLIQPPFKFPKSLDLISIEKQRFVVIVQASDDRRLKDIMSTERALIYDSKSWGGRLLSPWLKKHISPEQTLCELDALETIAVTIGQGVGYGIVPEWYGLSKMTSVRCINLPGAGIYRELVLLHRRLNPAILKLLRS